MDFTDTGAQKIQLIVFKWKLLQGLQLRDFWRYSFQPETQIFFNYFCSAITYICTVSPNLLQTVGNLLILKNFENLVNKKTTYLLLPSESCFSFLNMQTPTFMDVIWLLLAISSFMRLSLKMSCGSWEILFPEISKSSSLQKEIKY